MLPAVVERLGGAIFRRNIGSPATALNAENDTRQNAPVIHARQTARRIRQQRPDFIEMFFSEPENLMT